MARIYATTNPAVSEREIRNMNTVRAMAAQGMVLLENDGTLPIKADGRCIALFGNGARRTIKGGTGSGDVNSRVVYTIEQGLEEAGFTVGTKAWIDRYDQACDDKLQAHHTWFKKQLDEKGFFDFLDAMTDPYTGLEVPLITDADLEGTDPAVAIYVVSRNSGEFLDRKVRPGDYELTDNEKANITFLTERCRSTVVVLNVGGVIDTAFLRAQKGVGAVLLMSQAGNISGLALADVLTGKSVPSGHLTTTWAKEYTDYPCADTFSYMNGDLDDEYYREGIFVGYRYFDSFGVTPAYPFGFGRSYASFEVGRAAVLLEGQKVTVQVPVRNTHAVYSGKEVIQVYVSQPQGELDKPYQVLAGYAKTGLLKPGAEETLTITFPVSSLASYSEQKAAYLLEKGEYIVRVGTHSRNTCIAAVLCLNESVTVEQLQNHLTLTGECDVLKADPARFITYAGEADEKAAAARITVDPAAIPVRKVTYSGDAALMTTDKTEVITIRDVLNGKATLEELTAQLTDAELADLCVGTARGGLGGSSTIGAASDACPGAAGDTTSALLESRGVQNMTLADGPAGVRIAPHFVADSKGNVIPGLGVSAFTGLDWLFKTKAPERPADAIDYYQYCTAIPIATLLAQTWDLALIEEAGDLVGGEMEEFGVTLWLAPGMNIHRNPLCGRNFEYYSEDPLVAGRCAAADTLGVQKHAGCGTTIKHFALNNQEDNRNFSMAHCTERAIREIYLKGFEIAVRESAPLSLMTSYNLINGTHAANNKDLVTYILRDEWGFDGMVMTDWGTTGSLAMGEQTKHKYGTSDASLCIKAGNDMIQPGSQADVDRILQAVEEGTLTRAELQLCAKRVLALSALRVKSQNK